MTYAQLLLLIVAIFGAAWWVKRDVDEWGEEYFLRVVELQTGLQDLKDHFGLDN